MAHTCRGSWGRLSAKSPFPVSWCREQRCLCRETSYSATTNEYELIFTNYNDTYIFTVLKLNFINLGYFDHYYEFFYVTKIRLEVIRLIFLT